eukprot:scaffold6312_cov85-Cylindrotheca_fusiformis.AAC.6
MHTRRIGVTLYLPTYLSTRPLSAPFEKPKYTTLYSLLYVTTAFSQRVGVKDLSISKTKRDESSLAPIVVVVYD